MQLRLPQDVTAALVSLTPVVRRGRRPWQTALPLAELTAARFPKLVVSGRHSAGFEAIATTSWKGPVPLARSSEVQATRSRFTGRPSTKSW